MSEIAVNGWRAAMLSAGFVSSSRFFGGCWFELFAGGFGDIGILLTVLMFH